MRGYLNFKEACTAIGVKKSTMYNLMNAGKFSGENETISHMSKRWFSEKAIDRYIQSVLEANK